MQRVVVVGAGAAGLMAAIHAAREGASVVLLESTRDGGRKILASGGGRCNVLPSVLAPERFVTDSSPNTLRNLLRSWPLAEQRQFFEVDLSLPLILEPDTGKLFPASHRARDVRDALVREVRALGVEMRADFRLEDLVAHGSTWNCRGPVDVEADAVILATGGLSVPRTGSDGHGLALAGRLGHTVVEPYPALTPLLSADPICSRLAGLSCTATLEAGVGRDRVQARGGFLFTHRGFSGPVVLDLSHRSVRRSETLRVRWIDRDETTLDQHLRPSKPQTLRSLLRDELPARLVDALCEREGIDPRMSTSELRREDRRRLIEDLLRWPLPVDGHEGYGKAEVTGGGVALAEVESGTLQSRRCTGLYFAGEILDAFGPIGGHNFAWAWATGRAAGRAAARGRGAG